MEPKRMAEEYRRSNHKINIIGKEYPKQGSGANAHLGDHRYTSAHEQKGIIAAHFTAVANCWL
jgi:hypothetical protein